MADHNLYQRLEQALLSGLALDFSHTSTPPTKCSPIFAAPLGKQEQRTYCETHFLTCMAEVPGPDRTPRLAIVFALEVFIYTTATLTTLFVSKADSTGYLHLVQKSGVGVSPIRLISQIFLEYLVDKRRRQNIPFVVSLFARAQNQYLFPGSVENSGKHVLDDRGLIKWWCKVLDPLLRRYEPSSASTSLPATEPTSSAYLTVPGYDRNENQALLPLSARNDPTGGKRWNHGHPLSSIAAHPTAPPRCLIPRFPDDPKSRFVDELDAEILDQKGKQGGSTDGSWRSVKSMGQFWDMMQFRQECSSGRLVGFVWVVIEPASSDAMSQDTSRPLESQTTGCSQATLSDSQTTLGFESEPHQSSNKTSAPEDASKVASLQTRSKRKRTQRPTGPIQIRTPGLKTSGSKDLKVSEESKYYFWPQAGRGDILVTEKDYKKMAELLLRLDFASLEVSQRSTERWLDEVALFAKSKSRPFVRVTGKAESHKIGSVSTSSNATVLLGRKSKPDSGSHSSTPAIEPTVLGANMIRKKPKDVKDDQKPEVNMLSAGLVRKKAKA